MTVRLALSIFVATLAALRIAQRVLARRQRMAALGSGGHRCPSCSADRVLITDAIALPGEAESATVDLEALACRRCDLRGVGVRRATVHRGYPMDPIAWGRLSAALRRCPAPRDPGCVCPTHAQYGPRGLDEVPHDAAAGFDLD